MKINCGIHAAQGLRGVGVDAGLADYLKSKHMIISWFSAGITSAVACKLAVENLNDVRLFYIETGSHHADNLRFLADCEKRQEIKEQLVFLKTEQ